LSGVANAATNRANAAADSFPVSDVDQRKDLTMQRLIGLACGSALLVLVALPGVPVSITSANAAAVVYCKRVGVPKGCVMRPVHHAVVYCKTKGVPKGCVMRP
jgi:hypothetical protein